MYDKSLTLGLFICIIFLIIGILVYNLLNMLSGMTNKIMEKFDNKRTTRIKIYKSDEIFDPDELPEYDENDPDSNPLFFKNLQ